MGNMLTLELLFQYDPDNGKYVATRRLDNWE
jgi:hypothetical protein